MKKIISLISIFAVLLSVSAVGFAENAETKPEREPILVICPPKPPVPETKSENSNNTSDTNKYLTREDAVTRLWEMSGKPQVNYLMTFEDVNADNETAEAIRWASSEKIVNGYDKKHFAPDDFITNEQFAKIIYGYVSTQLDKGFKGAWMFLLPYKDSSDISDWASEGVHWLVASRMIPAEKDSMFLPKEKITCADSELILSAVNDLKEEKSDNK